MAEQKTEKAKAPAKPSGSTFRFEQVICTRRTESVVPGPPEAAITAAQNAGHRVTGDPEVVERRALDPESVNVLVVWSVPVKAA